MQLACESRARNEPARVGAANPALTLARRAAGRARQNKPGWGALHFWLRASLGNVFFGASAAKNRRPLRRLALPLVGRASFLPFLRALPLSSLPPGRSFFI